MCIGRKVGDPSVIGRMSMTCSGLRTPYSNPGWESQHMPDWPAGKHNGDAGMQVMVDPASSFEAYSLSKCIVDSLKLYNKVGILIAS